MQCLGGKDAGTELVAHLIIPKQQLILALHWMNNLFMTGLKSTTALPWVGSIRILHRLPFCLVSFWIPMLQEAVAIVCSIKHNNKRCFHLTRHRMNVIKDCKQSGFHQHSNTISPSYEQYSHVEFRDVDFDVEDLR